MVRLRPTILMLVVDRRGIEGRLTAAATQGGKEDIAVVVCGEVADGFVTGGKAHSADVLYKVD
jgi:hypothetical protein